MEIAVEMLLRLGVTRPAPVTRSYAPPGGQEAVGQILETISDDSRAVLLSNHVLLLWGENLAHVVWTLLCLEENAQMILASQALGGPRIISEEQAQRALARGDAFQQAGDLSAPGPPAARR